MAFFSFWPGDFPAPRKLFRRSGDAYRQRAHFHLWAWLLRPRSFLDW